MRYYNIVITDPNNPSLKQVYTSQVNGQNDPGALNVQFDMIIVGMATPNGNFMVEIWGIPLQSIAQANNLSNKNITISAGFQKGLPLANPAQSGIIAQGFIRQAYGNWIGTDMTLNLVVSAGTAPVASTIVQDSAAQSQATVTPPLPPLGSITQPINGSFNMPVGIPLSVAIAAFIKTALPTYSADIAIQSGLTFQYPIAAVFRTLSEFAQWLKEFSLDMVKTSGYPGIEIRVNAGNQIVVYDGTSVSNSSLITTGGSAPTAADAAKGPAVKTVDIAFQDLIGQPTWIEPFSIQFKCPMRADIQIGYQVTLPPGFYSVSPSDPSLIANYRNRSVQQGTFIVYQVRHLGNFRQADAGSWVSVFDCYYKPPASSSSNGAPGT